MSDLSHPKANPNDSPVLSRVLIVEDNVDNAQSLELLLNLYGYVVQVESRGENAVNAAMSFRPHAVILDIGLPRTHGGMIARAMKSHRDLKHIPLIALSGYPEAEARRLACSETQFDHYLLKPAEPRDLLAVLTGACTAEHARFSDARTSNDA